MKKVIIAGMGVLGNALYKKLAGNKQIQLYVFDKKNGNAEVFDNLSADDLIINCSEGDYSRYDSICNVFNTDNISTKNGVIIQNVKDRIHNGSKIIISRPYDINRRSYSQEKHIKDFFGIDCEIYIKKNDLDDHVYYDVDGYKFMYNDEFAEREDFVNSLMESLKIFIYK